jgi:hypothetical protein
MVLWRLANALLRCSITLLKRAAHQVFHASSRMAATHQTVGDGISQTFAISRAPDTEHRALGVMEFSQQIRFPIRE